MKLDLPKMNIESQSPVRCGEDGASTYVVCSIGWSLLGICLVKHFTQADHITFGVGYVRTYVKSWKVAGSTLFHSHVDRRLYTFLVRLTQSYESK